jgi:hypothetical protein
VPREALTVTKGEAKLFKKVGDSGATVFRAFCGDCGTPLWSLPANEPFLPIKVGALDNHADLAPQMDIYTDSAPAWHPMGQTGPRFGKMPPHP